MESENLLRTPIDTDIVSESG